MVNSVHFASIKTGKFHVENFVLNTWCIIDIDHPSPRREIGCHHKYNIQFWYEPERLAGWASGLIPVLLLVQWCTGGLFNIRLFHFVIVLTPECERFGMSTVVTATLSTIESSTLSLSLLLS